MTKKGMSSRDKVTLGLLIAMSVFLFADQRIMSAIIRELSAEYGVKENVLGFIGSAFTLVGALISIFFGYFTDKTSRKNLLIATVLVGEIPCLLTGFRFFTPDIESFTILRILSGIGIGGIYPISFSLIADYFSEEHRATASAWLGVSWMIGMVLGPVLAGYLTGSWGWRPTFILVALPNFPIILLFALYAKEPERGRTEHGLEDLIEKGLAYKQTIELKDFKIIFSNKTNIWLFLHSIPGTIPWGILGYWLIHFLEQSKNVTKEQATTIFLLLGIGATAGSIFFAWIGEKLYNRNPKYMPTMCGIGVLTGIIPIFVLINIPVGALSGNDLLLYYILSFLGGFLVAITTANVKAMIMNVNRPEHRGSVFAVYNITDNIGQGFGPAIGGLLVPFGYLFTMNFALPFWIPCGLMLFVVAATITADRNSLRALMKTRAMELAGEGA